MEEDAHKKSGFPTKSIIDFFSDFVQKSGDERLKKRYLHKIARNLKKKKQFFHVRNKTILPGLGEWFYDIYRIVGPAKNDMLRYGNSDFLKTLFIESHLPEEVHLIREALAPDAIKEKKAEGVKIQDIAEQARIDCKQFSLAFDSVDPDKINSLYGSFQNMYDFCQFPFYSLLKQLDPNFTESDYYYKPQFVPFPAKYVVDDLVDFLELLYALKDGSDWEKIFQIFKSYRSMEIISYENWVRLMHMRQEALNSKTLELIIRYVTEDLHFSIPHRQSKHDIVVPYINRVKTGAELVIQGLRIAQRKNIIKELVQKLFGATLPLKTINYNEKKNPLFQKRRLPAYTYVEALGYLKTFFTEIHKKQIRILVDTLIIQGVWINKNHSQILANSYSNLFNLADKLTNFDRNLADDGEAGANIKQLLRKALDDKTAWGELRTSIRFANIEAKKILEKSLENLIILGKSLKKLVEDRTNLGSDYILNWNEICGHVMPPFHEQIATCYEKIYLQVKLLQIFVGKVKKTRKNDQGKA